MVNVTTSDATNLYDIGVYTKAGSLIANIGAQHLPNNNIQTFATVQGAQTIPSGLYIFTITGNAATASISYDNDSPAWVIANSFAASSGGALPSSIGAQAVTPATSQIYFQLY